MNELELLSFPTSESAKRQLGYVSGDFYEMSYVGKWLFQVMGLEYDDARSIVEELPWQMFPDTATWGLKYHEVKWLLPVREDLPYEERRRRIFKRRDLRSPMTPCRMEQYLANATGFEIIISDAHDPGEHGFSPEHPNMFKVTFIGEKTVDTGIMRGLVDSLKQSHTMYLMCDRIVMHADHCGMEAFIVKNVILCMRYPFFREHGPDGGPLQGIVARNLYQGITAWNREFIGLSNRLNVLADQRNREEWKLERSIQRAIFPFFMDHSPDGNPLQEMRTGNLYRGCRAENKETVEASLVKKKSLWRLNGAVPLNGGRKLNAKISEEEL